MNIKQSPKGDIMVLNLSGKIMGGPSHDEFKAEIKGVIDEGYKDVILDLKGVPWINSTGLGILISGYHSLKAAEGSMKVCNVKERVLSIFYISQLENIFDVYATREEALASVGLGSILFWWLLSLFWGMLAGVNTLVSQAEGANDRPAAGVAPTAQGGARPYPMIPYINLLHNAASAEIAVALEPVETRTGPQRARKSASLFQRRS